jgi:hypothetical protein
MGLFFFITSMLFLLLVARRKRIRLMSPFGLFALFQALYNIVPWALGATEIKTHSLLSDPSLISSQLLLAASANVAFGSAYLFWYRNVPFPRPPADSTGKPRRFVILLAPLLVLTLILANFYGWNSQGAVVNAGGTAGGLYGIASYMKEFMIAAYLYHLYRFGLNRWAWVLFAANMAIMIVDGARTTGFPIIVLTLMIWSSQIEPPKRRRIYWVSLLGVVLLVGTRSLIVGGESLTEKALIPVTVEGLMGSYSSLQSIYVLQHNDGKGPAYTYGGSYLIDPVLWLFPQGGGPRATPSLFDNWVKHVSGDLPDDFAPMGGFYFISEAVASFGYIGPFVVAGCYALLLILMERNKRHWYGTYLAFTVTIGLLFVKTIFGNVVKLFVIQVVFLSFFFLGRKVRLAAARHLKPRASQLSLEGQ